MVLVRKDVCCIEVCSDMNEWMDCIFLVSKEDEKAARVVLEKAFDEFWDQENECYGDWLESKMKEAGLSFEAFYTANETQGGD